MAHEPPLDELLDDREDLRVRTEAMVATYLAGDPVGAWRQFLTVANITMPDDVVTTMFGGDRDPQTVADEHFQYAHMLIPTTHWQPDLATLRGSATRIVVGIGERSGGQLCDRASRALAAGLGVAPAMFPGGHVGFVDDPERFAVRLLEVLA